MITASTGTCISVFYTTILACAVFPEIAFRVDAGDGGICFHDRPDERVQLPENLSALPLGRYGNTKENRLNAVEPKKYICHR